MTRFPVKKASGSCILSDLRYGSVLLADPYPKKRDCADGKKYNKCHHIVGNDGAENIKGG